MRDQYAGTPSPPTGTAAAAVGLVVAEELELELELLLESAAVEAGLCSLVVTSEVSSQPWLEGSNWGVKSVTVPLRWLSPWVMRRSAERSRMEKKVPPSRVRR